MVKRSDRRKGGKEKMNIYFSIIVGGFFGFFVGFGMQTNIWGTIGLGSFLMFGLFLVKLHRDTLNERRNKNG